MNVTVSRHEYDRLRRRIKHLERHLQRLEERGGVLAEAAGDLVTAIDAWNADVEEIIGRQPRLPGNPLERTRAALALYEEE